MQKKIVAAICAAALALAMPAAAFAAQFAGTSSEVTASIDEVKNGNVKLTNIEMTGVKGFVNTCDVIADGAGAAPSNAVAGSSARYQIKAWGIEGNDKLVERASLGTKYSLMTADVEFAEAVTANLPLNASLDNLYVAGTFVSNKGGVKIDLPAEELSVEGVEDGQDAAIQMASTAAGKVKLNGVGTGTLTIWMQQGKYAAGDANPADVAKEAAADASKSPKTGELL